jgi:hypothetical protein
VFSHKGAEAVLQSETCEDRAFMLRDLAIEIQLGGPPSRDSVFKLEIGAPKEVTPAGRPSALNDSISRSPGSSISWE